MRYLSFYVLRPDLGDCTNNGVTSPERASGKVLLVPCDTGNWNDDDIAMNPDRFVVFDVMESTPIYRHLRPRCAGSRWTMMGVRHFIGKHSLKLSAVLIDGAAKEAVLAVIDSFKWVKGRDGGWKYSEYEGRNRRNKSRHNRSQAGGDALKIKVRERDKRHDWGTVK